METTNYSQYKDQDKAVDNITPTTCLQLEAIKQLDPQLALLLASKDPIKAAEVYSELKMKEEQMKAEMKRKEEEAAAQQQAIMPAVSPFNPWRSSSPVSYAPPTPHNFSFNYSPTSPMYQDTKQKEQEK